MLSASSFEKDLPVLADGYRACGAGRDRQGVESRREGRLQVNGRRGNNRGCWARVPTRTNRYRETGDGECGLKAHTYPYFRSSS